ncbi:MAG: GtrA family protein [Candidatus Cryptobacteroides sp.]
MRRVLIRYLKFMGTSVVGTVVDTLVLWILSDFIFTKGYWGEYIISPAISFQCALTANFLISYFYVWKDRTAVSDASAKRFFKLYFAYNLSGSAVFLLRLGALLVIEKFTGWDVVLCNLLAMCVSGVLNFAINNMVIFKKKKTA